MSTQQYNEHNTIEHTNGHNINHTNDNDDQPPQQSTDSTQLPIDPNNIRVLIDSSSVGAIIGREGCNVKHVRDTTSCIVSIAKVDGQTNRRNDTTPQSHKQSLQHINPRSIPERILTLRGDDESIVNASKYILQLLIDANNIDNPMATPENIQQQTITYKLLVHKSIVGCIIGKEGMTIKQLQDDSNARIQISNQPLPGSTDKTVSITGTVDSITSALQSILQLLHDNPIRDNIRTYPYQPQLALQMMSYDQYGNGMLYSPHVYAQPPHAPANAMYPPISVASHEPQQTQKIAIPSTCAGAIIGRSGRTIKEIRLRTGCVISIAEQDNNSPNERVVTLTGSTQSIHMAILAIRSLVEQQSHNQQQHNTNQNTDIYVNGNGHNDYHANQINGHTVEQNDMDQHTL